MSFFIYVPPAVNTQHLTNPPIIYPQNYSGFFTIMAPTITNTQFTFSEYPAYYSQAVYGGTQIPEVVAEQENLNVSQNLVFESRARNLQKQIQSAKKNGESNLINQFFSFFNNKERSQKIVQACISSVPNYIPDRQKIMDLFYNVVHVVNVRKGRKYVNRKILISLFKVESLKAAVPELLQKVNKIQGLEIQDICHILRKCIAHFYRTLSIDAILVSKRITSNSKKQHLKRRRKVLKAIYELQ